MVQTSENQPQSTRKLLSNMVAIVVLLVSLAFLLYHLLIFDEYDSLLNLVHGNSPEHNWWLAGVLLLLPFNLLAEALKWKTMTRHIEHISLGTALKSILAGAATGFITPNRIGEIVGRTRLLKPENRNRALSLAITGSVTQNLAILLPGIPALILFLHDAGPVAGISNTQIILFYTLLTLLLMISIPVVVTLLRKNQNHKISAWLSALDTGRMADLLPVLLLALVRWCISCIQFGMFLIFAGIEISFAEAFTGIAATYLLITFTPSFAVSEGIIRASWALFFIGYFAGNNPAIALAGAGLWIINVVLPVLAGNIILFVSRRN
jgi:hypothetical protein